jgi:hypothetical protein
MLNPVLIKEFRTQLRSHRYYTLAILYVLIISVVVFAMFWSASTSKKTLSPEYDVRLSFIFFTVQMLAIYAICPNFAISSISIERQNLNFDVMRSTSLKHNQIISGKILPIITYILILLFLSLPVALLIMPMSGGMAYCYLIVFVSTTVFCLMGFAWSSIFKNMRTATTMTYVTVGIFAFGTLLVPLVLNKIFHVKIAPVITDLLNALNPLWVISKGITGSIWSMNLLFLPIWSILILFYLLLSVIVIVISLMILRP